MNENKTNTIRRINFSLVEMLIAIIIFIVLLLILLPSLARTKNYAKEVNCLSNLRQIGLAVKCYLHDYDNKYPDNIYFLNDFTPYVDYIKDVNCFKCPGRKETLLYNEEDNLLRETDYLTSGTIRDVELRFNLNNGAGNNVYHFDPSNPGTPTQNVVEAKTNDKRIVFERNHSNHFPYKFNIFYIDTSHSEFDKDGVTEYWTLDDRDWIDTSLEPWPTY